MDESTTELQRILANLDPIIGNRIASLHCRNLLREQSVNMGEQSWELDLSHKKRNMEEIRIV